MLQFYPKNMAYLTDRGEDLLKTIGLYYWNVPRFRGCYYDDDNEEYGKVIVVRCRAGGNNRVDYDDGISYLKSNKYYLDDCDDSFDNTYAEFYFKLPEETQDYIPKVQ